MIENNDTPEVVEEQDHAEDQHNAENGNNEIEVTEHGLKRFDYDTFVATMKSMIDKEVEKSISERMTESKAASSPVEEYIDSAESLTSRILKDHGRL